MLDEAELLNPAGQNVLLKTLEEPPPGTFLILVTSSGERLLPTVRSRCQRVGFQPLPDATVGDWITRHHGDLDAPTRGWVTRFADGSLGRAGLALDRGLVSWSDRLGPLLDAAAAGRAVPELTDAGNEAIKGFAEGWVKEFPQASKEAANRQAAGLLAHLFARSPHAPGGRRPRLPRRRSPRQRASRRRPARRHRRRRRVPRADGEQREPVAGGGGVGAGVRGGVETGHRLTPIKRRSDDRHNARGSQLHRPRTSVSRAGAASGERRRDEDSKRERERERRAQRCRVCLFRLFVSSFLTPCSLKLRGPCPAGGAAPPPKRLPLRRFVSSSNRPGGSAAGTFPRLRYALLGIDLDGTLLQPDHVVAQEEREAIDAARAAGCLVVPCTGRSWQESKNPLLPIEGLEEGVFVTGCMVQRIRDGEVLHHVAMTPALAHELIEHLRSLPEAVLAFRTKHTAGHDFLVTGDGELTENTRWWFEHTGAGVKHQRSPGPEDLFDCVRVGVVSSKQNLGDSLQSRAAALRRGHPRAQLRRGAPGGRRRGGDPRGVPRRRVQVDRHPHDRGRGGIPDAEIAFIGDQINDLPALEAAGLSVAMGNAVPEAAAAASRQTLGHTEHGVAHAIHRMLAGAW